MIIMNLLLKIKNIKPMAEKANRLGWKQLAKGTSVLIYNSEINQCWNLFQLDYIKKIVDWFQLRLDVLPCSASTSGCL